jgi:hypothetical protein
MVLVLGHPPCLRAEALNVGLESRRLTRSGLMMQRVQLLVEQLPDRPGEFAAATHQ